MVGEGISWSLMNFHDNQNQNFVLTTYKVGELLLYLKLCRHSDVSPAGRYAVDKICALPLFADCSPKRRSSWHLECCVVSDRSGGI